MIVKSVIISDNPQVDGRRIIRELHIDDEGVDHVFDYIAEAKVDVVQRLSDRAQELNAEVRPTKEQRLQKEKAEIESQIETLTTAKAEIDVKLGAKGVAN